MDKIEAPWDRLEKILKSLSVKDLIYYESILIYVLKMPDLQASLIIVFFYFFSSVPDESKVQSLVDRRPGKKFLVTAFLFLEIAGCVFVAFGPCF